MINKEETIYHVTAFDLKGDVRTPEWDLITSTESVRELIDNGSKGDRFFVAAFNLQEGSCKDVTQEIAEEFEFDYDGETVAYAKPPEPEYEDPNEEHRLCHFTQGTGRYGDYK